jgi:cytochrome b561
MTTATAFRPVTHDRLHQARYDGGTIALHWLTAFLVIALFSLAEAWGFVERGSTLRRGMQALHISFGILLAAVFVFRIIWRRRWGHRLPPAGSGLLHWAAKAMHGALYGLLAAQIVLGFLFRWAQGEPFTFFGLFAIPNPIWTSQDKPMAHIFAGLHDDVAWIIIGLAGAHAVAALVHHYGWRDGVLHRMRPM